MILGLGRILPRESAQDRGKDADAYERVPLRDVGRSSEEGRGDERAPVEEVTHPTSMRRLRICFLILVLALCLRAEVLHRIIFNVQCSTREAWTPLLLPLAFAVEDWWRARQRGDVHGRASDPDVDDQSLSAYEALGRAIAKEPMAIPASVLVFGLSSLLALAETESPRSTYICATTLPYRLQVPHLQFLGISLDVVVVWCIGQLLSLQHAPAKTCLGGRVAAVGYAFLIASATLLTTGMLYYYAEEADRMWIMHVSPQYLWSLLRLVVYIAFTLSCALALVGIPPSHHNNIAHYR